MGRDLRLTSDRRTRSVEFGADEDAAVPPAAVEAARQGTGDRQPIAAGAELGDGDWLPGAPVGTLLAVILKRNL